MSCIRYDVGSDASMPYQFRPDIYIRPKEGLVMVDDLGLARLPDGCGRMQSAAITQTSPQNYQAWVRVNQLDTKLR